MSKAHNQFNNNVRVEETVNVEPINSKENTVNQPTFNQSQLDAIVAKAVEQALAVQAAAQAAAAEAAKKAETEKAASAAAEAVKKSEEAAQAEKAKVEPTKTGPKEGEVVISKEKYEQLLKKQDNVTINHNWGPYGSDFNTTKSSDGELDPWVVGGIAIGFVAVVAGIYYWVLKD